MSCWAESLEKLSSLKLPRDMAINFIFLGDSPPTFSKLKPKVIEIWRARLGSSILIHTYSKITALFLYDTGDASVLMRYSHDPSPRLFYNNNHNHNVYNKFKASHSEWISRFYHLHSLHFPTWIFTASTRERRCVTSNELGIYLVRWCYTDVRGKLPLLRDMNATLLPHLYFHSNCSQCYSEWILLFYRTILGPKDLFSLWNF